ncbi:ribbon-helix-helix protein, CopG family [Arthrobacter glacialis]|uniref:ribbon-helix-helix protein, CopG family n=1 Tax=Arthrobacter glacialis TaxID=1664 RepID=UPI000CD41DD5|nr:ribbon-helix-helix protein, CopG family [Arthrobacter glacialis]POH60314.1 CopG family transcriptional regulator [Arthrobacter glacialis]
MSSKIATDTALVRLNVNLNKETAAALKEIAAKQQISLTEAVRRAVAVLKFIDEEKSQGRKIQTMDSQERNKREVVLM